MKTLAIVLTIFIFSTQALQAQFYEKVNSSILSSIENYNNIAAWGDYDNDGDQDVVISALNDNCIPCALPLMFFRNVGNGVFVRVHNNAIAQHNTIGSGLAWGDYDNDGKIDLFVCGTYNSQNTLFHNDGNGDFTKVTTGIIVNDVVSSSQGCSWMDYNKDGWVDLFVTNRFQKNFLYKNNGDGTFIKITTGDIVNDISSSRGCAWGDYDNDSWQDLFVANYDGLNDFLYHNNGDGTFTKVNSGIIVNDNLWGSCCSWLDYDQDGNLDLLLTNTDGNNKLYKNNGGGNFTLPSNLINQESNGYGLSWGDYNNDGFIDIFLCNPGRNNSLFMNTGSSFVKVTNEIVGSEGIWSVAGSFVDYDRNGKLDLLVTNRFSNLNNYLYKNVGETGNYITIRLRGCNNKFGIGARLKIKAGELTSIREVTSGSGWGSDHFTWSHFGIGDNQSVDSLIVYWPSGHISRFSNVPSNQSISAHECPDQITGFSQEISEITSYELYQNYPNPFNPTTTIRFEIPENQTISLKIYNVLGNEVTTLFSGYMNRGSHSFQWDATGVSSGIYFYRLKSENMELTKSMVVMK